MWPISLRCIYQHTVIITKNMFVYLQPHKCDEHISILRCTYIRHIYTHHTYITIITYIRYITNKSRVIVWFLNLPTSWICAMWTKWTDNEPWTDYNLWTDLIKLITPEEIAWDQYQSNQCRWWLQDSWGCTCTCIFDIHGKVAMYSPDQTIGWRKNSNRQSPISVKRSIWSCIARIHNYAPHY
jgi:hypothetical protein